MVRSALPILRAQRTPDEGGILKQTNAIAAPQLVCTAGSPDDAPFSFKLPLALCLAAVGRLRVLCFSDNCQGSATGG